MAKLRVAVVTLLAAVISCPPSPPPSKPTVSEIEIVPSRVAVVSHATEPTTFLLEARLWSGPANDRESIVASAGIPLTWTVTPPGAGLHFETTPAGYLAKVVLDPGAAPTAPIQVKVEAGGLSATSQIIPSAISSDDPITAVYADGMAPDAVVARGIRGPTDRPCAVWLAPAMVRTGLAGPVADVCTVAEPDWGVALLGQGHGMEMYPVKWDPLANPSSPSATTPVRVLPVATRVFITGGDLTRQTNAAQFAHDEILYANSVFTDSRVGIKLDVVDAKTVTPPNTPGFETDVTGCGKGDDITSGEDHTPATEPMLHIYLVDGTGSSADAFTCGASDKRPYPVIYLAIGRSGTILLHEVGHALGLDLPGAGHTDEIAGFDPADVMAGGYADSDAVWRSRLTVGQVLRMNADGGSWLAWAADKGGIPLGLTTVTPLACQCGYDDPAGRCPRLSDDVARKRGGLRRVEEWGCGDQIWMDAGDVSSDNPIALIAGREWRTGLGACPRFFPGSPLLHDNRTYIQVGKPTQQINLTRPGGCQSWVAIFFESHRPVFRSDPMMDGAWSVSADTRFARDVLNPMSIVTLHVWYDGSDAGLLPAALAETEQIYGKGNRGGLKFAWTPHKTLPTTCPSDIPGPPIEYQVCWSSTNGPTIPQLIGLKWGLHLLTSAELSNLVYSNNVMKSSGVGTKLTLGQLFHVHANLKTPDFPDCSGSPSPCPPLEADAP